MAFQTFPQEKSRKSSFWGEYQRAQLAAGRALERRRSGRLVASFWRQGAAWLRHPFTRLGPPDRARPRPAAASPWRRDEGFPSRPTPHRQLPTRGSDELDSCPLLLCPSDSYLLLPHLLLPHLLLPSLSSPSPFLLDLIYIVLRPRPFPCSSYPSRPGASGRLMDLQAQR